MNNWFSKLKNKLPSIDTIKQKLNLAKSNIIDQFYNVPIQAKRATANVVDVINNLKTRNIPKDNYNEKEENLTRTLNNLLNKRVIKNKTVHLNNGDYNPSRLLNLSEDAVVADFNKKMKTFYYGDYENLDNTIPYFNAVWSRLTKRYLVEIAYIDEHRLEFVNKYPLTIEEAESLKRTLIDGVLKSSELIKNHYNPNVLIEEDIIRARLILITPKAENANSRKYNGFFQYENTSSIPLEKYQIYTSELTNLEKRDQNQSCLIYALQQKGISKEVLESVMVSMQDLTINIPLSKMNEIANIINKRIMLYTYDEVEMQVIKPTAKKFTYGNKNAEIINLAQYKNHIFIYEDTIYTKFYLENLKEINALENEDNKHLINEKITKTKNKISNVIYRQNKDKKLNTLSSLQLVVKLMKLNYFTHMSLNNDITNNNIQVIASLDNIENDQRLFELDVTNPTTRETIYLFGDLETDVSTSKYHKLLAFGCCDINGSYMSEIYPAKSNALDTIEKRDKAYALNINQMLLNLVKSNGYSNKNKRVVMFFHNLKYDSTILDSFDKFYKKAMCSKDGQVYSATYCFGYELQIELRDSMKHFGGTLKSASKTFDLPICKLEAIDYNSHTIDNISSNELVSSNEYCKNLSEKDQITFNTNVLTKKFNKSEYYLSYLKQDVLVLQQAMIKYRSLMKIVSNGLDPFEFLTVSSIAHKTAKNNGCYDDLYETKGSLRNWIQESVRGGRVYVNPEFKNTIINDVIQDFDGVSLYPSSMKKLCDKAGLPKGEIKKGLFQSYNYYESKDYYFVKIQITKINKQIQIPCVCYNNDDSLKYLNEITDPIIVTVDKITLNDYITFQDIDFTIIEGIYWDNGFNKSLGNLVDHLHNERCKVKKTNKPLGDMIKLLMNSIYGKTCQKRSDSSIMFISNKKANDYIYNHFGLIKSISQNSLNTVITKRAYDSSYSLNFVGAMILSMSKRIMNRTFNVMDDYNMPVFYTDTDSIHMLNKDVEKLGFEFKNKYNTDLIGENLGMFHSDFDMANCKDVVSIKHIPIATKTYLDVLKGINKTTNEVEYSKHVRMKGMTDASIKNELNKRSINRNDFSKDNDIRSAIELFTDLTNNVEVEMVLNPTKFDVRFVINENGVRTRQTADFKRVLNKIDKKTDNESDNEPDNKTNKKTWKWF